MATKTRSDVLTISIPADLVPELTGALEHMSSPDAVDLAGGQLTARREPLDELLRVAIEEAGDQVGLASTRLLRGEGSAADLRGILARLTALMDLLDGVDA